MPSQSKKKPTAAKQWKGKASVSRTVDLPSGNTVEVRLVPITKLLSDGVFPDSLSVAVQEMVSKSKGERKQAEDDLQKSIFSDLGAMFKAMDKVTIAVMKEPRVLPDTLPNGETIPASERDEDELYVDEISADDKMFLFQLAVGGTSDAAQFRREAGAAVGGVVSGAGLEDEAV